MPLTRRFCRMALTGATADGAGVAGAGLKRFMPRAAPWTSALPFTPKRNDAQTVYLPQAIAHRGYNASLPENSMAAFEAAVAVGAHALETDLRLTADGVVVLSHDPSLKRCYGVNGLVGDSSWEYLSSLRTMRTPAQPMARFDELLMWLASDPRRDTVWLMLDIKIADSARDLMVAIKEVLDSVPSTVPWNRRVVLGCWNASYMQAAFSVLPEYPVTHISPSRDYSCHFLPIPNVGFSILRLALLGAGARFLEDAKARGAPTFSWTVNDPGWMDWMIRMNIPAHGSTASTVNGHSSGSSNDDSNSGSGCNNKSNSSSSNNNKNSNSNSNRSLVRLDGVITDDPKLFLQTCARIQDELNAPLSYVGDPDSEPSVLDVARARLRAAGQACMGSFFSRLASLILWYRGYADYFSDLDFLAEDTGAGAVEDGDVDGAAEDAK